MLYVCLFQLTANEATGIACQFMVVMMHYFTMTNFFWMLVEGSYTEYNLTDKTTRARQCVVWYIWLLCTMRQWQISFFNYLMAQLRSFCSFKVWHFSSKSNKIERIKYHFSIFPFLLLCVLLLFCMLNTQGLYLYMLVVETFSADNINLKMYAFIGWGKWHFSLYHSFIEHSTIQS